MAVSSFMARTVLVDCAIIAAKPRKGFAKLRPEACRCAK
jgi:hypothetical protein